MGNGEEGDPAAGRSIRVVLADDDSLWREGVARLLGDAGIAVVAQAADAEGLTEAVDRERPDVAVVDVRMPPTHTDDGLRAGLWIRRNVPGVGVLVLCQHVHAGPATKLLEAGDSGVGYLLKERVADAAELVAAVRLVAGGGTVVDPLVSQRLIARRRDGGGALAELTDRELEVLALLAAGCSNQQIADRLVVTRKTVEAHLHTLMRKLGVTEVVGGNRRVHAVLTYLRATEGEPPVASPAT